MSQWPSAAYGAAALWEEQRRQLWWTEGDDSPRLASLSRSGPHWPGYDWASTEKLKKMSWAAKAIGPNWQWAEKFFSQFLNKDFSFKIKDSNAFKPNLNWSKLGINLK
jgi:hypothetical protein